MAFSMHGNLVVKPLGLREAADSQGFLQRSSPAAPPLMKLHPAVDQENQEPLNLSNCGGASSPSLVKVKVSSDEHGWRSACMPGKAMGEADLCTQLVRSAAAAKVRDELIQRDNARWLQEFDIASEEEKIEQRDKDVQVFEEGLERLVQQVAADAVQTCKRHAENGATSCTFEMTDLSAYPMGKKLMTGPKEIRSDPELRGWFFKFPGAGLHDPARIPPAGRIGEASSEKFVASVGLGVVERLEQEGLQVLPGECFGMLELTWGEQRSQDLDVWGKWW